jgi:hypothetical protein
MLWRVKRLPLLLAALMLAGCATHPALRVERVEFGPSIWSEGQRRAGVLFQDGAQAIPVAGGTLWLFGDTFFGQPQAGLPPQNPQIKGATGTTIAFLPAGETNLPPALNYFTNQSGTVANPLTLFADEPPTNRMWPAGGISIGPRNYLFYSMIETTTNASPWNFRGIGGGLAVASQPLQEFVRLRPDGQWKFPVEPIQVLRVGQRIYLYEISSEPKGLILAQVSADQIEHPAAYEFFTGQGWSKNRADVKVIQQEIYGQVSIVWLPTRQRYLMTTSSDFFHPREIQLREASHPAGPWSVPVRIAVPELPGKKTSLVYCAYLHPELSDASARRFVATFCRILAGNWELSNPEWVTITLAP